MRSSYSTLFDKCDLTTSPGNNEVISQADMSGRLTDPATVLAAEAARLQVPGVDDGRHGHVLLSKELLSLCNTKDDRPVLPREMVQEYSDDWKFLKKERLPEITRATMMTERKPSRTNPPNDEAKALPGKLRQRDFLKKAKLKEQVHC
jgi:hypothetical protein